MIWIGILEGIAEAVTGYSKGTFGIMSDRWGRRLPFVRIGYFLSALSKPLMGFFTIPGLIFASRTLDRLGKGIRTGARDAILSDESNPQTKGKVFGFHRSMDTLGACIGPFFALWYLENNPNDYKSLFFIAFLPGICSFFITLLLSENKKNIEISNQDDFSQWEFFKNSPLEYKKLVMGLLGFALLNSSDFFLLLKIKESGMRDSELIYIYIFYNLVYAIFSYPVGILSDKWGMKNIYTIGLIFFSLVYLGMGMFQTFSIYLLIFFLYGLFAACTEGISKAWIATIVPEKASSAIGVYSGWNSVFTLISSSLAGLIWSIFGSEFLFYYVSFGSLLIGLYIYFISIDPRSIARQQSHHS
jgi:MFS family permease